MVATALAGPGGGGRPGDIVVVERLSYFLALDVFRSKGFVVHGVRLDQDGMDTDELERFLNATDRNLSAERERRNDGSADLGNSASTSGNGNHRARPRVVAAYVMPVHHNPTGVCWSPARRTALLRLSKVFGFTDISDEVYGPLSYHSLLLDSQLASGSSSSSSSSSAALHRPDGEEEPGGGGGGGKGGGGGGGGGAGLGKDLAAELQARKAILPLASEDIIWTDVGREEIEIGREPRAGCAAVKASAQAATEEAFGIAPFGGGVDRRAGRFIGPTVVSIGSLSKVLSPGMKMAWLHAGAALLDVFVGRPAMISGGSPVGYISALLAASHGLGDLTAHLSYMTREYGVRCRALRDALGRHGVLRSCGGGGCGGGGGGGGGGDNPQLSVAETTPILLAEYGLSTGGYFQWLTVAPPLNAGEYVRRLAEEQGVAVLPGDLCFAGKLQQEVMVAEARASAAAAASAAAGSEQREAAGATPPPPVWPPSPTRAFRVCFARASPEEIDEGVRRMAVLGRTMLAEVAAQPTNSSLDSYFGS
jgi:DNA-binding transcriptional MocR family regulator